MYNTIVVLLKCQMPIVYSTKYQSALQKSGVQNRSEDSIAQMPRQSNNINRLLLSAFRKGVGDEKRLDFDDDDDVDYDDDDVDYGDDDDDVDYGDDDGDAGLGEGRRGQNVENPYIG